MKKTKIICTVGPSTDKPNVLENMMKAGMNVARFNFSHGTHAEHAERIQMVRDASLITKKTVALMLDTKGPEMRLGFFKNGKATLQKGDTFVLTAREVEGDQTQASVSHKLLPQEVKPDNIILLSDGLISLKVVKVEQDDIHTVILNTGVIGDRKRVATPGVAVNLPPLSEQDVKDILFGISHDMDFIAASFVQRASDVLAIRKLVESADGKMKIIAKIESAEGVTNIDEILRVVDGIMVARGDLGVEIPAEEVPLVQKMIIRKCNKVGKPVITATQMLESMVVNPRPTRAESSDVANAILDGTDVIMLSGETASGNYPVEAVETMNRIALRTEQSLSYKQLFLKKGTVTENSTTEAISHATVQIAHELGAAAIITSTESGFTAQMVSKYRPQANVVAVTPNTKSLRFMQLYWGVVPIKGESFSNTDEMVSSSVLCALANNLIQDGDLIVLTAGVPIGQSGTTNMIRVHVVGTILQRGQGVGRKSAVGNICVCGSVSDLKNKFKDGDILVVSGVTEESAPYAAKASAIIAEEGGYTSHAAVVGVTFGIPVLVGAIGATTQLADGMHVTVDSARGVVYRGNINAR